MSDQASELPTPLGKVDAPAPSARQWAFAAAAAVIIHAAAAAPFLPKLEKPDTPEIGLEEDEGIGVRLAPIIAPPAEAPPEPPEPEPEPVIEERADDSPPPAPPKEPRKLPDIPDIKPQSVPELYAGGAGGGSLTVEEYLLLQDWMTEARTRLLRDLSYPEEARRLGQTGAAMVAIIVDRDGRIVEWAFVQRTGYPMLDREVERTINRVRRLPKFPDGIPYNELTYRLGIQFELVYGARDLRQDASRRKLDTSGDPGAPPPPPAGLSVAQLSACASTAARLTSERDVIEARRAELEAEASRIAERLERFERQRRDPPASLRREAKAYEEAIAEYDARVTSFQNRAQAYTASCGAGSAEWPSYAQACAPYASVGNPYCEAFSDLWARLQTQ